MVCLALTSFFGGVGTSNVRDRVIAITAAVLFVILALLATRSISGELYRVTAARGGVAAGSVVRLVVSVVGYTLTAVVGLGMLGLPFERLLLGGAVTGVILGIAAQQALGKMFAGVVLLVARPFNPGDHIRIRSGALGGEFDGVVLAMGLTYVTVSTNSGVLSIPRLIHAFERRWPSGLPSTTGACRRRSPAGHRSEAQRHTLIVSSTS